MTTTNEGQHFCLKWNNHQDTLVSLFSSLLDSNTFVDCTLAASGKQIKAHKMILSACSPYFKEILLEHSDMHPIIILNNVQFSELVAIVEFMYRGEVNVAQDQLAVFLKAANALQIKGLTNDESDESVEMDDKENENDNDNDNEEDGDDKEDIDRNVKDLSVSDGHSVSNYQSSGDESFGGSLQVKLDDNDDSLSYPGPSTPATPGLIQNNRFSLDDAVTYQGGGAGGGGSFGKLVQLRRPNATEKDASFKCDACAKFYRSKTSLNLHKRWECGKEPKFACPYCDKKCHQKGNLKVHIISRHRDRIQSQEMQN